MQNALSRQALRRHNLHSCANGVGTRFGSEAGGPFLTMDQKPSALRSGVFAGRGAPAWRGYGANGLRHLLADQYETMEPGED